MTDREKIIKALSPLHASEDTVTEVLKMAENQNTHYSHKKLTKAGRIALIAAVVALALAGTALAVGLHTDFFRTAYGDNVESVEAHSIPKPDEDGNIVSYVDYPAMERVSVDPEAAEALVGDYVAGVQSSVTLHGYTFTLAEYVLDENGIGSLVIDVDNPDGLNISEDELYDGYQGEFAPYNIGFCDGSGWMLDDAQFRDAQSLTNTHVRYAVYLTPFTEASIGSDITVNIKVWNGGFDEEEEAALKREYPDYDLRVPLYDETALVIPAASAVPAQDFTGGAITASVSPVGMKLTSSSDNYYIVSPGDITITYADGSEYIFRSESVLNEAVSSASNDGVYFAAFNRLVDVENIASITVGGEPLLSQWE